MVIKNNFFFYLIAKKELKWKHFPTKMVDVRAFKAIFKCMVTGGFRNVFSEWQQCWKKCVALLSNYFEHDRSIDVQLLIIKVSECESQIYCIALIIGAVDETKSNLSLMGGSVTKEFTDIHTNEPSNELTYLLYFLNRFILQYFVNETEKYGENKILIEFGSCFFPTSWTISEFYDSLQNFLTYFSNYQLYPHFPNL